MRSDASASCSKGIEAKDEEDGWRSFANGVKHGRTND